MVMRAMATSSMRALAMQRMAMGFLAHQQGTLTSVILTSTKVPHTCRSFSSGMTKSDDDNGPRKELSPYQQLQKWLQPFVQGSRAMYHENKQAWHVRAKLKQHQQTATTGVSAVLTRQEMMILRQAHRDLLKALPLLAFFCVPLVGYAAPVIGYAFPKQLLPWQFWRPDQKTQFFSEDAQAKAAHYPELRKLLLQMDRKQHNVEEMLARNGHEGLNPAEVGELVPFFDRNGPAFLDTLPRHHLHVLSQSIALMPAFSWLVRLFPKNMVQQYLERRADELRVDDLMLLREGIDGLSLSELEFACEERGIVTGYGNIDALRGALREWLSMYDTDHVDAAAPQCFPSSLLLHAPALGRFSNAQIDTK